MKVEITYCGMWNYLPQASRLEEEIKGKFSDIEVKLIEGSNGVFRIKLDGEVIFDKAYKSRFPKHGEISKLIE